MNEKVKVKGIALKEGVSLNNVKYTREEILKASEGLNGKTIIKDHNPTTDNSIGLIERIEVNNAGESLSYYGWVEEDGTGITRKVADGRVKVSIGAMVEQMVEESEDSNIFIAKGIHFMELSTTPTPGVNGAFITTDESFNLSDEYELTKEDEQILKDINGEETKMEDEKKEQPVETKPEEEKPKEEVETQVQDNNNSDGEVKTNPEETKQQENLNMEKQKMEQEKNDINENFAKEISDLKNQITEMKTAKAQIVSEEKEAIPDNYVLETFEGNLTLYKQPFGKLCGNGRRLS